MRVEYMVLADAADALNDRHYILGGGISVIAAPQFPATHPRLAVALKIEIPWQATSQEHQLELDILDADGHSILQQPFDARFEAGRPPGMRPGDTQSLVTVLNFMNLLIQNPGSYRVVCRLDGSEEEAATQSFKVVVLPGQVEV